MADSKPVAERIGLTRGKAMLIGTLAVVLAGVVYLQFGSGAPGDGAPQPAYRPSRRSAPRAPTSVTSKSKSDENATKGNMETALATFDETRWKAPELATVVAYDPFALPAAFPQSLATSTSLELDADAANALTADDRAKRLADAIDQLQRQLEELKQRGVHVIIGGRNEYVAVIGERTLHVGDEINGFIVTAIEPDGVRVEGKSIE